MTMNSNRTGITGDATRTYNFDLLNRLTQVARQHTIRITYWYDSLSRRTRMILARGLTVNYTYDQLSRLTKLTDRFSKYH